MDLVWNSRNPCGGGDQLGFSMGLHNLFNGSYPIINVQTQKDI